VAIVNEAFSAGSNSGSNLRETEGTSDDLKPLEQARWS
jgi:hypothetical protein